MDRRLGLKQSKKIVVKIGTALLISESGMLNKRFINRLAQEVLALKRLGKEIVLVSSGAIGTGILTVQAKERPRTIPAKQAMAAIGQPRLMQAYERSFRRLGLMMAQVLLTSEDLRNRQRYSHARDALQTLLAMQAIPIINENDTVAVEEIKFGDNDELSAQIANLAEADLLIILTNVDGLCSGDPGKDPDAKLISRVEKIDARIEALAGPQCSRGGTGGMMTKLRAAKKVTSMGKDMVIANGRKPRVLQRIIAGEEIGTIFYPRSDRLASRKQWIVFTLKPRGVLVLDEGARRAIQEHGKSLLPSGIRQVEGNFQQGDCVDLRDEHGRVFARGLVKYAAEEIRQLCGVKSTEIERVLGYKNTDEIIHRDDLALVE